MRGDPRVVEYLQRAIRAELTAYNQYTLHAAVLDNLGFPKLSAKWKDEAAEEAGHRDRYIERMIFLGATPDVQTLGTVRVGADLRAIFRADMQAELEGRALYIEAAAACFEAKDFVSYSLFTSILADEEHHINFLETQNRLLDLVSERGYGAQYIDEFEGD